MNELAQWMHVCEFKNCAWSRKSLSEEDGNLLRDEHYLNDHHVFVSRGQEADTMHFPFIPASEKNERRIVLEEAAELIDGDRQAAYGPPAVNFQRIADALNGIFGPRLTDPLSMSDVALIMIVLKLSRQVNSSKRDNWIDIAGYAALGAEVDQA